MQVVFEGATMDAIVAEVRTWLEEQAAGVGPVQETDEARREREVREVLAAIKGPDTRRLVHELAEAAIQGKGIRFDDALKARYGKTSGTSFAGIVGAANKVTRRVANRDLIARDTALGGWRLDPLDAAIVLATWRPGASAGTSATPDRPAGIDISRARRA